MLLAENEEDPSWSYGTLNPVFDEGKHGDLEISMEICLILLQIVLNLDQRVKHLLINKVNQYSLGTVFLPNQWRQGNGEGSGLNDFLPRGGGGGGCLSWTIGFKSGFIVDYNLPSCFFFIVKWKTS